MTLSIIILNYKTKNLVKQCLKNIVNLSLPFEYEIIVVDNNSEDRVKEMIKERFPQAKFVEAEKNHGMGAGNNLGVQVAQGEYVLILNPDVVVLENSIEKLLEFIRQNEKIGCVAPQLLYPDRSYQPSRYRFPKFYMPAFVRTQLGLLKFGKQKVKNYFMEDMSGNGAHQVDWVRGAVMLFRKDVYQKVGGFDENFFFYLEDTDLCRRLWQAGFEIWYVPEAKMIHYYFRESKGGSWLFDLTKKLAWVHIISWFRYFWKWRKIEIRN